MNETVNVLCLKWGTKYGPEYVNKLYNMVSRNLTKPFRFVCITDDSSKLNADVEAVPLLHDNSSVTGWWHKLSVFSDKVYDLTGPCLFLDLDLVIVDNIDCFFEHDGKFCIIHDWNFKKHKVWNSSVFRFQIGEMSYIYDEFKKNHKQIMRRMHGDQNFITEKVPNATLWPTEWCKSFKYHCSPKHGGNLKVPEGSKMIIFHGKPNPHEVVAGQANRWGNASWVRDHWC